MEGHLTWLDCGDGFLEDFRDNFLIDILDGATRGDAQLDLLLTNKEELVGNMEINGSHGCSYHEMSSRP